uniref:hypothetical protein n=1 Tax=Azohydromonas australica TaxID=364039 RepID=UPI0005BCEB6C
AHILTPSATVRRVINMTALAVAAVAELMARQSKSGIKVGNAPQSRPTGTPEPVLDKTPHATA